MSSRVTLSLAIAAAAASGLSGADIPEPLATEYREVSQSDLNRCWELSTLATKAFEGILPSGDNVIRQMYFTAVVESGGGKYIKQLGGGPARSLFQVEPTTANDIFFRYFSTRDSLKEALLKFSEVSEKEVSKQGMSKLLESNPKFAAGIARLVYAMQPSSIPSSDLWDAYAKYWKKYYQKGGSKGLSAKEALFHFNQLIQ